MAFHGDEAEIGRELFCRLKGLAVQDRQELSSDLRPDGRNALEQIQIPFQAGMTVNVVVDVVLQLVELLAEEVDRFQKRLPNQGGGIGGISLFEAVTLALQVLSDGFASGQQGL